MKTNLQICFLFCSLLSFSQTERALINKIDSINAVALDHYNNDNIAQSFNLFNQAIKLSDSIHDTYGNSEANFTLGKIYDFMHEPKKAQESFLNVISVSKKTGDNYLMASSFLNLGKMFMDRQPSTDAIPYFEKALLYASKGDVRDQFNIDRTEQVLFETRINLFQLYLEINNTSQAFRYLSRAEENLNSIADQGFFEAKWKFVQGQYFVANEHYSKASIKFLEATTLLENQNSIDIKDENSLLSEIYKDLSTTYVLLDKDSQAYSALLMHNNYKDEFFTEEKITQNLMIQSKFSIANYKNAAQLANVEKMRQVEATNKFRVFNIIISIALILVVISLVAIYKSYVAKRKLNRVLELKNTQLEFAKNQAEKSSELKSIFISNVTHELRTPFYGVVGLTSLLLKNNDLSEKDSKFLKSLKYSGDYLLNLVNDILQIGKIESKKIELKNVSVNIRVLLENLVNSFDYRLEETNNQIQIEVENNIPEFIKCDSVRLSQVLIDLIGNSIKFTEDGKIYVIVKLLNIINDKVNLRFEIEDNGPGIPKEKQKMIFENFSQLDDNSNTNYQGTGLGLPITKNLVELFGSQLEVESEIDLGSTFSFDLTLDIDRAIKANIVKTKKAKGDAISLTKKYKILVAEDNKINQIVTQNLLQRENYECVIAKNGKDALEAHKDVAFDLILMDMNMPIMNGNEATKVIREFDTQVPIIALTAADIEQVKDDYKAIGYDDIITKPFDNYEFFQTISQHIQRAKSIKKTPNFKLVKVS